MDCGATTIKTNQSSIAVRFLLTDLYLSTESRHTRHFSQPELTAPFQDAPGFTDHFPSSTFIQVKNTGLSFNGDSLIVKKARKP